MADTAAGVGAHGSVSRCSFRTLGTDVFTAFKNSV